MPGLAPLQSAHIALTSHSALVLWAQVAALLATARLLGALVRRMGQPDIVGSLLAGVLLGPSVLGWIWPAAESWLVPAGPHGQGQLLGAVTGFALLILLIVLGAETDLGLLRSLGRAAATVSAGTILIPGAACVAAAYLLAHQLAPAGQHRLAVALAVGGALSVSSLPVVARIVIELGMSRRNVGQLSIAAATLNDVYGFGLLVAITVLTAGGGLGHLVLPLAGIVGIGVLLLVVGQRVVDEFLRRVRAGGPNVPGALTVCVVFAFGLAAVAQSVEVDAALGAFVAGIVLGRSRFQHAPAMRSLEHFTAAVFAPLYFASAGLQIDLRTLGQVGPGLTALALLAAAVLTKYAGALAGAAAAGLPRREAAALGVALNGRGAMQVIIGSAALSLGVIGSRGFTVLLVISVLTSLSLSPLLRRLVHGWPGTSDEQQRLAREEQLAGNVIIRGQRLLLPTRGSANARAAALVMDQAWPPESELTYLEIVEAADGARRFELPELSDRPVRSIRIDGSDVVDAILAEANLGYGVIGLGAVEHPTPGNLLPPIVSELFNRSPLPLLLVRRARGVQPTGRFDHLIVPVTGTAAARAAQEVANCLSGNAGSRVDLLHVQTRPGAAQPATEAVLSEARGVAEEHGVRPAAVTRRESPSAGDEIVRVVRERGADAVVLGTRVRRVDGHPFLGHTTEHVLEHCRGTTVIVVVMPDVGGTVAESEPYADRQAR